MLKGKFKPKHKEKIVSLQCCKFLRGNNEGAEEWMGQSGIKANQCKILGVDFSYCWINLEVLKYSLEQYIGFAVRQAFNYYCSLHQVWREVEN